MSIKIQLGYLLFAMGTLIFTQTLSVDANDQRNHELKDCAAFTIDNVRFKGASNTEHRAARLLVIKGVGLFHWEHAGRQEIRYVGRDFLFSSEKRINGNPSIRDFFRADGMPQNIFCMQRDTVPIQSADMKRAFDDSTAEIKKLALELQTATTKSFAIQLDLINFELASIRATLEQRPKDEVAEALSKLMLLEDKIGNIQSVGD